MSKQDDTMAILKLYELRRDEQMRLARQWYFSEFAPESAMDIAGLFRGGERASASFRMVTSYWDTAASLVLNGGIDRKMFLDANTEHVIVYAKIEEFLPGVRELFRDANYLVHLEQLVRSMEGIEGLLASRKHLISIWNAAGKAAA